MIRLTKYDRLPQRTVRFTRKNIFEHYDYRCAYCGKKFKSKELNFDHVVPRSHGGKTGWDNIVPSCYGCNTRKADRTPREAGMKMYYLPSKPKWHGNGIVIGATLPIKVRESWQRVIDSAYWDSELEQD
jgi:5-methylcytosine-specific restriction endonuclease McrA